MTASLVLQCVVEFIGTLFLALAVIPFNGPIEVGLMLMAMVFAGGHISGAHYNPVVSLAFGVIEGKPKQKVLFVVMQLAAAVCAAMIEIGVLGGTTADRLSLGTDTREVVMSCFFELLGTFALVFVILCVSATVGGNKTAGVAFGGVVVARNFLRFVLF